MGPNRKPRPHNEQHAAADETKDIVTKKVSNGHRGSRIRWTAGDWIQIAKHLRQRNPILMESSTMVGVSADMILRAARDVLPSTDIRPSISNIKTARIKLVEAVACIRREQKHREHPELPDEEMPSSWGTTKHTSPAKDEQRAKPESALVDLSPVVDLIVSKVEERLMARIEELLDQKVGADWKEFVRTEVTQQLHQHPRTTQHAPAEKKVRHLKCVVVGPLGDQQQMLRKEFPDINFEFAEGGPNGLRDKIKHCDFAIGMAGKMSRPANNILAQTLGKKYTPVQGGMTSIREAIRIKQGALLYGSH